MQRVFREISSGDLDSHSRILTLLQLCGRRRGETLGGYKGNLRPQVSLSEPDASGQRLTSSPIHCLGGESDDVRTAAPARTRSRHERLAAYSKRSAISGSVLEARRAGIRHA